MRWMGLLLVLLVADGIAGGAAAQAPRTRAQILASPRDVREIFLALPRPAPARDRVVLARMSQLLASFDSRRAALETASTRQRLLLDPRNGYLRLTLEDGADAEGEYPTRELVLTYFNRSNGEKLVVLQLNDYDTPTGHPNSEDYVWTLAGGRFTPRNISDYLPPLEFTDFWGGTRPADVQKDFFLRLRAYHIQWPQEGTVALFRLHTPDFDVEEDWAVKLTELFERRRFGEVDLVWDRQHGRFIKGRKYPYEPESEDHDHH